MERTGNMLKNLRNRNNSIVKEDSILEKMAHIGILQMTLTNLMEIVSVVKEVFPTSSRVYLGRNQIQKGEEAESLEVKIIMQN